MATRVVHEHIDGTQRLLDCLNEVSGRISLAQIGELSFVIANIGTTSGVARPSLLAIAVGVCCVTTLTSGVSIARSQKLAEAIADLKPASV